MFSSAGRYSTSSPVAVARYHSCLAVVGGSFPKIVWICASPPRAEDLEILCGSNGIHTLSMVFSAIFSLTSNCISFLKGLDI